MSDANGGASADTERPCVLVLCACQPFSPAHSVASSILAHCALLEAAGYAIRVLVPEGRAGGLLELGPHTELAALPPGEVPAPGIETALESELSGVAFAITHDVFLLDSLAPYREAVVALARRLRKVRWFHWLHSLPAAQLAKPRRPAGGVYVVPSDACRSVVAARFQCSFDAIAVVPHVLPLASLIHDPDARRLAELADCANAEVVQLFPASAERLEAKGLSIVLRFFGELRRMGIEVRLMVATSRSATPAGAAQLARFKELGARAGLTPPTLLFTADLDPAWQEAFPRRAVVECFTKITNFFLFPSISETASLVTLEAAAGKNLLVLNESLPMMREQFGAAALYVPFGSVFGQSREPDLRLLASQVLDALFRDRALAAHRRLWSAFSTREVSKRLFAVLERHEDELDGAARRLPVIVWGERAEDIHGEDLVALWPETKVEIVARARRISGRWLREAAARGVGPWIAVLNTEVAVPKAAAQAILARAEAGGVVAAALHPIFRSESAGADATGKFVVESQYLGLDLCLLRSDLIPMCDTTLENVDVLAQQMARRLNAIGGRVETCTMPYRGKIWSRPALTR